MLFSWFRASHTYTAVPPSPLVVATPPPTPVPYHHTWNSHPSTPIWMRNAPKTPELMRPRSRGAVPRRSHEDAFLLPPPLASDAAAHSSDAENIVVVTQAQAEAQVTARKLATEVACMNVSVASVTVSASRASQSSKVEQPSESEHRSSDVEQFSGLEERSSKTDQPAGLEHRSSHLERASRFERPSSPAGRTSGHRRGYRPVMRAPGLRPATVRRPDRTFYTEGMELTDGSWYAGELRHGDPDGQGVRVTRRSRYTGMFRNGLPNGLGVKKCRDGVRLEGTFRNGILDGVGTRACTSERYDGMFRNGLPDGQGVRALFTTGVRYEGGFRNGEYEGQGKRTTPEYAYEGAFYGGTPHGLGTMRWTDGEKVIGYFERGRLTQTLYRRAGQKREQSGQGESDHREPVATLEKPAADMLLEAPVPHERSEPGGKETMREMVGEEGFEPPASAV